MTDALVHRLLRQKRQTALGASVVCCDEEVFDGAAKEIRKFLSVLDSDSAEAPTHDVTDVGLGKVREGNNLGLVGARERHRQPQSIRRDLVNSGPPQDIELLNAELSHALFIA